MLDRDSAREKEQPAERIRVWAYEFGDCPDPVEIGRQLEFRDLRASGKFPASALAQARLMAITIRRADLWRLIDPAAGDGAIVVWPSSPASDRGPGTERYSSRETIATRVISLVRVDHPEVVSARRRATLNVRSVVFTEDAWRRHAGNLLTQAIHILRQEFEAVIGAHAPVELRVGDCDPSGTGWTVSAGADLLRQAMTNGTPTRLGRDSFESGLAFWISASEALRHSSRDVREHASLACGFAAPFGPAAICYSPTHQTGSATAVECLVGAAPHGANGESRPDGRLIQLHARDKNAADRPAGVSRPGAPASMSHSETAGHDGKADLLDRLEQRVSAALRFPPGHETAFRRAQALVGCEGDLLGHLAMNGFFLPHELDRIQQSPSLSALVRHIIDSKPHAIFSRLQTSLTILAAFGPPTAASVDECLRKFLPPAWPATELLESIAQRWALRQALVAVQRSGRIAAHEATELRDMLLARLSCDTLAVPRSAARAARGTPARSRPV
jgi:hypothetical protein